LVYFGDQKKSFYMQHTDFILNTKYQPSQSTLFENPFYQLFTVKKYSASAGNECHPGCAKPRHTARAYPLTAISEN